jgi:YgiT-type zinc finger domain-containing protein
VDREQRAGAVRASLGGAKRGRAEWDVRLADAASTGEHPRATLREIEVEWDGRLARLRVRLLERVAQQSAAATWTRAQAAAPTCPACGARLEPRGRRQRRLRTTGGQEVLLQQEYGVCPQCGQGLFPPG